MEKDLKIDNLIYLQRISKSKWLMTRFLFYFVLVTSSVFILVMYYGILSEAIKMSRIILITSSSYNFIYIVVVSTFFHDQLLWKRQF